MGLTEQDQWRIGGLHELERRGQLSDYVGEVVQEIRSEGVGRERDPRTVPDLGNSCRVYEMRYQPPSRLDQAEVVHAICPSQRCEIADRVMKRFLSNGKRQGGNAHG